MSPNTSHFSQQKLLELLEQARQEDRQSESSDAKPVPTESKIPDDQN